MLFFLISSVSVSWSQNLITFQEVLNTPFEAVFESSIAFADVNGDTKPDLVIAGENSGSVYISKLYINTSITTGIDNREAGNTLTVYPNPSGSDITIRIEGRVLRKAGRISVCNSTVEMVMQKYFGELTAQLNLKGFSTGSYYVILTGDSFSCRIAGSSSKLTLYFLIIQRLFNLKRLNNYTDPRCSLNNLERTGNPHMPDCIRFHNYIRKFSIFVGFISIVFSVG